MLLPLQVELMNTISCDSSALLSFVSHILLLILPPLLKGCKFSLQLVELILITLPLLSGNHDLLPELCLLRQRQLASSLHLQAQGGQTIEEIVVVVEFVVENGPVCNRLRRYVVFLEDWVSSVQVSNRVEQPLCVWGLENDKICSAHHCLALIHTQILVSIDMVFDGLKQNVCQLLLRRD